MGKIIIKNIKELVQVLPPEVKVLKGKEMAELATIKDAWVKIVDDIIVGYGKMSDCPIEDESEVMDATGKMVFPSWCDSHTHIVYAKSREEEFVDRINGLSYQEIASKGGGILNSAKKLQNASEQELYEGACQRIKEIQLTGTGAVEIKSGYGLTVEAELKMLRVIKRLKENSEVTIRANFLGAHALPVEFKENRRGYIDLIINEMLPKIKAEGLADFIDVFCETNYYTPEEASEILLAGKEIGLIPKFHTNQFTSIGGIQVGVKHKALSVDHLEVMTNQDMEDLAHSEVMPTLLPSCSFFLNITYAPAKELINKEEVSAKYDDLVFGLEEEKLEYTSSKCCKPIPGDRVFGFITITEGIKIHKKDCPNAISLQSNYAYRVIKAKWIDSSNQEFKAILKVSGEDNKGIVNNLTMIISSNMDVFIHSINIAGNEGIFDGKLSISVKNRTQLNKLIESIKKVDGVKKVERVNTM